MNRYSPSRILGFAVAVACVGLAPATLADVGIQPSLELAASRQSNPQMSFTPTPTGSGALVRVDLPLDWHGDVYSGYLKPVLTAGFQQGNVVAGIHDQRIDFNVTRSEERSNVQLTASVTRSQLYGQTAADVATFSSYGTVQSRRADFSATYAFTERLTGAVGAGWRQTKYTPSSVSALDFTYPSARGQLAFAVTPKLKVQLGISAGKLSVPGVNVRSEERSATATFVWAPVEGMEVKLGGGPTKTTQQPGSVSRTNTNYNASVNWNRPTFDVSLFGRRGVVPSSGGVLTSQSDYGFSGAYRTTERLSFNGTVARSKFSQQIVGIDLGGRAYTRIDVGTTYQLTEQWGLSAGFGRGRLEQTFNFLNRQPGKATSSIYSLRLVRSFGRQSLN
jgi:hypothetical protein